jgi:hypothetical protein
MAPGTMMEHQVEAVHSLDNLYCIPAGKPKMLTEFCDKGAERITQILQCISNLCTRINRPSVEMIDP